MLISKLKKEIKKHSDNQCTVEILNDINPVEINNSEYIFIFNQVISKFTEKLYILVSHQLAKRKIPSCFLYYDDLLSKYYPRFEIGEYEISNSCTAKKRKSIRPVKEYPLFFEWTVDLENKKIEAEGINFFPFINNNLRKYQKRYNVIYGDEDIKELIRACDLLLKYFYLFKKFSADSGKKVKIVGYEAVYVPNGIFRMLCDKMSCDRDVEFIELRRGYINYFGQHHHRSSFISNSNLTKENIETGLMVSKEEIENLDEQKIGKDELTRPVSNALERRIDLKKESYQQQIIKKIEDVRKRGKMIFVLFPHVFYDIPADDRSISFDDMCKWISETIDYFKRNDNLLVIKPHPGELVKDQPKRRPNETLASFLADTELSENIILLEHDAFTVKDLSHVMSVGLIWRSSVAMELTFLGIPCIVAGNPPYRSLNLNYAKNKEHYFQMLNNAQEINVNENLKIETAKYLYLLEKKHIRIKCITYHNKLRRFYWVRKELKKYLKEGDANVTSIVDYMIS